MIDKKIESLLSATADLSDPLVAELAVMRQGLAEAFPLPVIPEDVEDSHLARMMAAVVPAASLVTPEVAADRTSPIAVLQASFARRVAAVTLAFSTAFGGAAYAGVLPDPVQRAVAKAASVVGLDLPGDEADTVAESEAGEDRRGAKSGNPGDEPGPVGSDDDDRSGAPNEDGSENGDDDRRDAREDAEDRREEDADRRDDEQGDAEDRQDDARDAQEDATDEDEDDADDRRDETEDREDDEMDEREDDEDDALEEAEDATDDSDEDLEDLEKEDRSDRDDLDDDSESDDSESSED